MQFSKIGIIGAMAVEVETLIKSIRSEGKVTSTSLCGMEFYEGTLSGQAVIVVQCGIGMVNASACTQALIDHFAADLIINTGVAGSLDASINIGDIVVISDAVNHVMDVSSLGYEAGQTPGVDTLAFPTNKELASLIEETAQSLSIATHRGRIASGDLFVSSDAAKKEIMGKFGASCCDMESAAIAQVSYLSGVPCVLIRAISDKADGSAEVDYPTFEKKAAHDCAAVTTKLLANLS